MLLRQIAYYMDHLHTDILNDIESRRNIATAQKGAIRIVASSPTKISLALHADWCFVHAVVLTTF